MRFGSTYAHRRGIKRALLALASTIAAAPLSAQIWSPLSADPSRFAELTGTLTPPPVPPAGFASGFVGPTLYIVHNSDIPYSLNDGALWAGRGTSASLTTGGAFTYRTDRYIVRGILAPTWTGVENLPFQIIHGADWTRSNFSSPWHYGQRSADLPLRFGDKPYRELSLGETGIEVEYRNVVAGLTSASEWWGPGIRNALVLSDNAAGIPRAFVSTARPIHTPLGLISGRLFLGTLTESRFFDQYPDNDFRSINGLLLTFRPAVDTALTLGFARTVIQQSVSRFPSPKRSLDALWRWGQHAPRSTDSTVGTNQVFSVFARWLFPKPAVEVYGEWARNVVPRTVHEWLVAPYDGQAFTLGLQSAHRLQRPGHFLRGQIEFSDLEQTYAFSDVPAPDFYTGTVPQGYTQFGQVIGAATGPGSSSQFVALDYIAPRWQAGAFIGRTRWENDAMYRLRFASAAKHDVTIYSGVRGGVKRFGLNATGELTVGRRQNYLFQNDAFNAGELPRMAIDVQNITLEFQLSR
jgi:hypothetical protein